MDSQCISEGRPLRFADGSAVGVRGRKGGDLEVAGRQWEFTSAEGAAAKSWLSTPPPLVCWQLGEQARPSSALPGENAEQDLETMSRTYPW